MFDPWDDASAWSLPWYRRGDVRWGLCGSFMLVVGFFLGWSTTWLRPPDVVLPETSTALQALDPFATPVTVDITLPEQPETATAPASGPTAVTQSRTDPTRQGS